MHILSNRSRAISINILLLLIFVILSCSAAASSIPETDSNSIYCFSTTDFSAEKIDGIVVTEVPEENVGTIRYRGRTICAGDVMPADLLSEFRLLPMCKADEQAVLRYLPIVNGRIGEPAALTIQIKAVKNDPPVAEDSSLQTYKNIENSGKLEASDSDGGILHYTITKQPKRGTVEIHDDGTFTYTPKKNKVGKDSFCYTVTDDAGQSSDEATVSIEILKPTQKAAYSDMVGDPDQFEAMWLKDNGIFAGETIAGELCFNPDKVVTRGEFLVMTMRSLGIDAGDAELTSGFADENQMPQWLRSYVVSAFRSGIVNGVNSDAGLVFRADAGLTKAEAAVIVQNILDLPTAQQAVSAQAESLPAWCSASIIALHSNGIYDCTNAAEPMSRREVACLLYQVSRLAEDQKDLGLLAWAAA